MPLTGRVAGIPMVGPLIGPGKEFVMLELFALGLSDWRLASKPAKMIRDFVFQNSDQPGPLGSSAFEPTIGLQCRQESFLHAIFSCGAVTQTKYRVLVKVISVQVHPRAKVRGLTLGGSLGFTHAKATASIRRL